jgi:uncharacterized protein (UPF0276 family)
MVTAGPGIPIRGGIGLRTPHQRQVLAERDVAWSRVRENFFARGGQVLHVLERVRSHYP